MDNDTNDKNNRLILIKAVHAAIWLIMTFSVAHVFYSGISGKVNIFTWLSVVLIFGEGLALLIGKGDCPLHLYAQKISGKNIPNDTYLPDWIFFRGYKVIMSIIFFVGLVLIVIRTSSFG